MRSKAHSSSHFVNMTPAIVSLLGILGPVRPPPGHDISSPTAYFFEGLVCPSRSDTSSARPMTVDREL